MFTMALVLACHAPPTSTEASDQDTGVRFVDVTRPSSTTLDDDEEFTDTDAIDTGSGEDTDQHEDTGPKGPVPQHEKCPEGYSCIVQEAPTFEAPSGTTQMNYWFMASCNIVWTGTKDVIEGQCDDLEFLITGLPNVSSFSSYPKWSLEVATVDCDDRKEECAWFYGPEDGFELAPGGTGMVFGVEAGTYGAPFSCDIYQECDTPATSGESYTWEGVICRNGMNPDSLADLRPGADFLECRGCDNGGDTFLGSAFADWQPLNAMECVIYE